MNKTHIIKKEKPIHYSSASHEMWEEIEDSVKTSEINHNTFIKVRRYFKVYITLTKTTNWRQMEEVKRGNEFLRIMKEERDASEGYLLDIFSTLSGLIKSLKISSEYEELPPLIDSHFKNQFEYIKNKRHFRVKHQSHPVRDRDEIELFISTLPDFEKKMIYGFYAITFRRFEVFQLFEEQFNMEERYIRDVTRKGGEVKTQDYFGIPSWIFPMVKIYLEMLPYREKHPKNHHKTYSADRLFNHGREYPSTFSTSHFDLLMKKKKILESNQTDMEEYQEEYKTLVKLEQHGNLTPHMLRSSWITYSDNLGMDKNLRLYHANHSQGHQDDKYRQIFPENYEIWNKYIYELDNKSVKYNFGDYQ